MTISQFYPIGVPGVAWSTDDIHAWRARQLRQRSYQDDVVASIDLLRGRFDVIAYGDVVYDADRYALYAIRSRDWNHALPVALVTGGVHGYETSGVFGALQFVDRHMADYDGRINVLVAPCISPWGYERVQRWNFDAIDPNRSFHHDSQVQECAALMTLVATCGDTIRVHIDLHETTDSDETEFRPALAARDGVRYAAGNIPDGFYLVDDSDNPQPAFQQAVIDAVAKLTHIAPADSRGEIIGCTAVSPGVISYPLTRLSLCASISGARFTTTTEVYPDSPAATPAQCNAAQVAAACAAMDFALAH